MPILGKLIAGLFSGLATWLGRWLGLQIAQKAAAVAALFGFSAVLMVAFNTLVAPLVAQAFTTAYGQVLGLAFPPIAGTCMATYAAVWSACQLYALQRKSTAILAS